MNAPHPVRFPAFADLPFLGGDERLRVQDSGRLFREIGELAGANDDVLAPGDIFLARGADLGDTLLQPPADSREARVEA